MESLVAVKLVIEGTEHTLEYPPLTYQELIARVNQSYPGIA
jgi:hypothetical protein